MIERIATLNRSLETITLETDGAVATIVLSSPQTRNSLSRRMRDEIARVLELCDPGDEIRVIRIKAEGPDFCAGYDMRDSADRGYDPRLHEQSVGGAGESRASLDRNELRGIVRWLDDIRGYRKPVVAQVIGRCLSGGLDLLGSVDIIFASGEARFGHPAARGMGVPITMGYLPMRVGSLRTKELMFTGDLIDAATALQWGMINRLLPASTLDEATMAFCRRTALSPLDGLTVHKHVVNRWADAAGAKVAVDSTIDLNVLTHDGPFFKEFFRIATEGSLREALRWRDEPFER